MLIVPVMYCSLQEWKLRLGIRDPRFAAHGRQSKDQSEGATLGTLT